MDSAGPRVGRRAPVVGFQALRLLGYWRAAHKIPPYLPTYTVVGNLFMNYDKLSMFHICFSVELRRTECVGQCLILYDRRHNKYISRL